MRFRIGIGAGLLPTVAATMIGLAVLGQTGRPPRRICPAARGRRYPAPDLDMPRHPAELEPALTGRLEGNS